MKLRKFSRQSRENIADQQQIVIVMKRKTEMFSQGDTGGASLILGHGKYRPCHRFDCKFLFQGFK